MKASQDMPEQPAVDVLDAFSPATRVVPQEFPTRRRRLQRGAWEAISPRRSHPFVVAPTCRRFRRPSWAIDRLASHRARRSAGNAAVSLHLTDEGLAADVERNFRAHRSSGSAHVAARLDLERPRHLGRRVRRRAPADGRRALHAERHPHRRRSRSSCCFHRARPASPFVGAESVITDERSTRSPAPLGRPPGLVAGAPDAPGSVLPRDRPGHGGRPVDEVARYLVWDAR